MSESLRDQLLKSGLVKQLKAEAPPRPERGARPAGKPDFNKHGGQRHGGGKHGGDKAGSGKPHGGGQHASGHHAGAQPRGGDARGQGKGAAQGQGKPAGPREPDLAQAYALRAREEKNERDAAQREVERVAREKRERKQKLTALLDNKHLANADADTPRHFPHGNKIRRIYASAAQVAELNRGELAVVQLAGRYLLVSKDVALQAKAIDEQALVLLCDPNEAAEDDIPADLRW